MYYCFYYCYCIIIVIIIVIILNNIYCYCFCFSIYQLQINVNKARSLSSQAARKNDRPKFSETESYDGATRWEVGVSIDVVAEVAEIRQTITANNVDEQ